MAVTITYEGGLITDTGIAGERKCDGIIPAHASAALRLSRDRWALFFSTLDPNGWDAVKSILYQIRADAPDGAIVREGVLIPAQDGWEPEPGARRFRKVYGMPMAFGVPKGALRRGKPYPNANVFAVKTYRRVIPQQDGHIVARTQSPEDMREQGELTLKYQRVAWLQFRLNDTNDDLVILQPLRTLMQQEYDSEDEFCALGRGRYMNHAMTPPVPADESCQRWCECDTFAFDEVAGRHGHGQVAPVEYTWNAQTGLYAWTRVGKLYAIPGRAIGETSISRWDDAWVVAARSNCIDGSTAWFRTRDLFEGLGEATLRPGTWGPRHSFRCADGQLRIFLNDQTLSPHGDRRNPLYAIDVHPETFAYSTPQVAFDARAQGLPFEPPFADMAKLCPATDDGRQLLVFRCISSRMTTGPGGEDRALTADEMAPAGIN